jgi:AraC-like DNA-binding protein
MLTAHAMPSAPLARHVELFWAMDAPSRADGLERVLPSGTAELVFNLRDPGRLALICGPHSQPFVLQRAGRESFAGIHFKPGGATRLLGVPESELANGFVDLDVLWGREARELRARLGDAASPAAALALLERALLARLERTREGHASVAYALDTLEQVPAPRSIGEIATRTGLSARRFITLFTQQVGLSPKLFARVRRFQRVLHLAHAQRAPDWARLALACGYYDQAHLVRDFGDFASVSPGAYLRLRGEDPNHIALAPEVQIRPRAEVLA